MPLCYQTDLTHTFTQHCSMGHFYVIAKFLTKIFDIQLFYYKLLKIILRDKRTRYRGALYMGRKALGKSIKLV